MQLSFAKIKCAKIRSPHMITCTQHVVQAIREKQMREIDFPFHSRNFNPLKNMAYTVVPDPIAEHLNLELTAKRPSVSLPAQLPPFLPEVQL